MTAATESGSQDSKTGGPQAAGFIFASVARAPSPAKT